MKCFVQNKGVLSPGVCDTLEDAINRAAELSDPSICIGAKTILVKRGATTRMNFTVMAYCNKDLLTDEGRALIEGAENFSSRT